MQFGDLDANSPTNSSRKANALLAYMQTLEGVLCPRFRLPPAQPVCATSGISRYSRAQLNTGNSLIKSLLKIMHMHMLFLIILRNLPSGLPPWTATQQ